MLKATQSDKCYLVFITFASTYKASVTCTTSVQCGGLKFGKFSASHQIFEIVNKLPY